MPFTPYTSLLGGLILSSSTTSLLSSYGRVLGISGLTHSLVADAAATLRPSQTPETEAQEGSPLLKKQQVTDWKLAVVLGLLAGGVLLRLGEARLVEFVGAQVFERGGAEVGGWQRTVLAGLLVGLGTKLGSGCTSGHMLCGLARLSPRSLVATIAFFASALLTSHLYPSALPPSTTTITPIFSLPVLAALLAPLALYTLLPRVSSSRAGSLATHFLLGVHFSFGLALAGMTSPSKVLGFFEVPGWGRSGLWDPSLMMVALGGLGVNAAWWVGAIRGWDKPRFSQTWELPTRRDVEWRLIAGSVLFGVGWGLRGVCPGPMLTNLGAGVNAGLMVPFFGAFALGGIVAARI